MINFSIVIPIYNEENNISNLIEEIKICFDKEKNFKYEVVIVNDGSTDKSSIILKKLKLIYKNLIIINNISNFGQSRSIINGINNTSNTVIVTLDGDGQNNPNDIPKLLLKFFSDEKIKLVGGLRKNRKDNLSKKLASKIANKIRMTILNDGCADTGCSLKVFDKGIFLSFSYFSGLHRFLPALFRGYGNKTVFIEVDHRKRNFGYSKYGNFNRLIRGLIDLLRVFYLINFKKIK